MNLETLPVILPVVGCGVVILGAFLAIILVFIQKARGDLSPTGKDQMVGEGLRWLDGKVVELAPWQASSIGDISDFVDYRWIRAVSEKTIGSIEAVSGSAPLIAFYTIHSFMTRHILASTTAHRWQMLMQPGGDLQISLNGSPFGVWRLSDGTLLDTAKQPIGHARRGATWSFNEIPVSWDDRWYEVTLRERVIGSILSQRGAKTMRVTGREKIPVVRPATAPLEAEAEQWLLALAIVEIAHVRVEGAKL